MQKVPRRMDALTRSDRLCRSPFPTDTPIRRAREGGMGSKFSKRGGLFICSPP